MNAQGFLGDDATVNPMADSITERMFYDKGRVGDCKGIVRWGKFYSRRTMPSCHA
jgi:hypothetical protein